MSQSAAAGLYQERIDMAMIAAFEFDNPIASGKSARQADAGHGGFGAAVDQSHFLYGRHPIADEPGQLYFLWIRNPKTQSIRGCLLYRFHYHIWRVSQDGWSPSSDKVDIFAPIDIPKMRAFGFNNKERFSADVAKGSDRRVNAAGNVPARFGK